MRFRILASRVHGLGLRVCLFWSLRLAVYGLQILRSKGSGLEVLGLGTLLSRILGLGFRVFTEVPIAV